jgi:hypothetical protein
MRESTIFMLENNVMNNERSIFNPTEEMEQIFIARSNLHRSLVKKNLLLMAGYENLSLDQLDELAEQHDLSKFNEPERIAYLWITWKYHCNNKGTAFNYLPEIEEVVTKGWLHHIQNNSHHPEAHESLDLMSDIHIVEMVCDWTAIAQENNNNSCLTWANMNIDKKWNFSLAKKNFIFKTIHELDKRRGIL